MIPIAIIAIINAITAMIIIIPTTDIRSTVPQYLQRLAWELTIFPQLRHLICFNFFLNYFLIHLNKLKSYKSPLCKGDLLKGINYRFNYFFLGSPCRGG